MRFLGDLTSHALVAAPTGRCHGGLKIGKGFPVGAARANPFGGCSWATHARRMGSIRRFANWLIDVLVFGGALPRRNGAF